eukprot:Gb_41484 [translate_table: standard]
MDLDGGAVLSIFGCCQDCLATYAVILAKGLETRSDTSGCCQLAFQYALGFAYHQHWQALSISFTSILTGQNGMAIFLKLNKAVTEWMAINFIDRANVILKCVVLGGSIGQGSRDSCRQVDDRPYMTDIIKIGCKRVLDECRWVLVHPCRHGIVVVVIAHASVMRPLGLPSNCAKFIENGIIEGSSQSVQGSIEKLRFTGLAMVNTRGSSGLQEMANMMKGISESRWGNEMGYVLLPLPLVRFNDPLDYVRHSKVLVGRKKLSLEAIFTYKIVALVMKFLGAKAAAYLDYGALASTSLTISNVPGPVEEIMFAGNPITYFDATISSLPQVSPPPFSCENHQLSLSSLIVHMVLYGKARMLVSVAKDIIPDPEVLAQCFEDSLQDMKKAIQREPGHDLGYMEMNCGSFNLRE